MTEQAAAIEQKKVDSLLSIDAVFDAIYMVCHRTADGCWRRDLDVAEWLGAIWAGHARRPELLGARGGVIPEPLTLPDVAALYVAACCATPPTASSSWRTTARAYAWRSSRR